MKDINPPIACSCSILLQYIVALVPFCILGFMFSDTISEVARVCWENDDYSHGLLLPFISLWLAWSKRNELSAYLSSSKKSTGFSYTGLALLIFGMLVFLVGEVSGQILFVLWFAFFPSLLGIICLVWGLRAGIVTAPILLLNFMARPIPESLAPILFNPLQEYAAKVSRDVLELFDVPVYIMGNVIEIPGMRLLVEEACSGMRSVMALLTVALIVIYLLNVKWFAAPFIAVFSVVIAVALNVLRVALTGVLAHFVDAELATGFFHEFTGIVVFAVGMFLLWGLTVSIPGICHLPNKKNKKEASS